MKSKHATLTDSSQQQNIFDEYGVTAAQVEKAYQKSRTDTVRLKKTGYFRREVASAQRADFEKFLAAVPDTKPAPGDSL